MKLKFLTASLLLAVLFMGIATPKAEARTHFSLNIGALFAPPVCETVYVEHYPAYPVYPAYPSYCAPMVPAYYAPAPVVYVAPRPCCYARPAIVNSVGFSWHSFR